MSQIQSLILIIKIYLIRLLVHFYDISPLLIHEWYMFKKNTFYQTQKDKNKFRMSIDLLHVTQNSIEINELIYVFVKRYFYFKE